MFKFLKAQEFLKYRLNFLTIRIKDKFKLSHNLCLSLRLKLKFLLLFPLKFHLFLNPKISMQHHGDMDQVKEVNQ